MKSFRAKQKWLSAKKVDSIAKPQAFIVIEYGAHLCRALAHIGLLSADGISRAKKNIQRVTIKHRSSNDVCAYEKNSDFTPYMMDNNVSTVDAIYRRCSFTTTM